MTKLDELRELNYLEKQNRKNRLEDKLKQQEYYGEIEELFDPLTKALNTNAETMQALQNQTLAALEDNTNALKSVEHQRQSTFLEQASLLSPTLDPPVTLKDDRGNTFTVDNDMIEILLVMGKQPNKQLDLKSVDPNSNKFKINGVDVSLAPNGIKVNGRVYDFSRGFALFATNKDVTEKDIRGEGNKLRFFLSDINYNRKRGDIKSNRVKLIRRIETSFAIP